MTIRDAALIGGILVGSVAILAVTFVWVRKQTFGLGGAILTIVGLACLGLSIWTTLRIKITESGVDATFELEKRVDSLVAVGADITAEVKELAEASVETRQQLSTVAQAVASPSAASQANVRAVRDSLRKPPSFDPRKLGAASRVIDRMRKPLLP